MRRIIFVCLAIFIAFVVFSVRANINPDIIVARLLKKGGIRSGELVYRVYLFGALPVGTAVFAPERLEEYHGRKVYHLTASAAANSGFLSRFFSASALLDSYVDAQDLNPVLFRQRLAVSGKADNNKEIIYDQKENIMSLRGIRRQIMPNTQDPLSAMLNIRKMKAEDLREFSMNINTNQKNYLLKAKAAGSSFNKMPRLVLLKAEISRTDKNPYHKTSIDMALLQEKENIPILIKVFTSGILISAKLIDIR